MSIIPVASSGGWRQAMPALAALIATAVILTTAATATASTTTSTNNTTHAAPLLAQGAGMGDRPSRAVRVVQRVLANRGYDLGAPGVDGRFGPITDAAVRRMQADNGLVSDGVVGLRTRRALGLRHRAQTRKQPTANVERPAPRKRAGASRPKQPGDTDSATNSGTQAASRDNANGVNSDILLALAAGLAVFWIMLFSMATRRSRQRSGARTTAVGPTAAKLHVEGISDAAFHRRAVATAVSGASDKDAEQQDPRYLSDEAHRPGQAWVSESEIDESEIHPSGTRLGLGEDVIGYVTLASEPRAEDAKEPSRVIAEACDRAGLRLLEIVTDRETGRALDRPGLAYALRQIAERRARGLVVADLRRLSGSIIDLGALMEWFREADAVLIALDLGIDTSTPAGDEVAATLATLSSWERERIARRTQSRRAKVRANGRPAGRPAVTDRPELADRINAMRDANMTLQAIADQLNAEGIPTIRGGQKWRPSSVQAALGYRRPGTGGPRDQLPSLHEQDRGV